MKIKLALIFALTSLAISFIALHKAKSPTAEVTHGFGVMSFSSIAQAHQCWKDESGVHVAKGWTLEDCFVEYLDSKPRVLWNDNDSRHICISGTETNLQTCPQAGVAEHN